MHLDSRVLRGVVTILAKGVLNLMTTRLMIVLVAVVTVAIAIPTHAQDVPDFPALTETFSGSNRLNGVSFDYPEDWHTLSGIPANRLVSFNVISSVPIGIRNQIEAGEEAVVLALAGGRIDRWGNRIEAGATPEEVLTAFFEQLGDDNAIGGGANEDDDTEFEEVVTSFTVNGFEGVRINYVAIPADDPTEEPEADADDDDAEAEFNGDFAAYGVLLDDNRFMVMLLLTSEYTFAEVEPLMDDMLDTLSYSD